MGVGRRRFANPPYRACQYLHQDRPTGPPIGTTDQPGGNGHPICGIDCYEPIDHGLTRARCLPYTRSPLQEAAIYTNADSVGLPDRVQLKRLLLWQVVFALAATLAALPFGLAVTASAAVGAAVCLLANWVFALRVFKRYRAQQPGEIVLRMYGAEIIKIAMILALFSVAFATIDSLNLPAMLGAYFAVQVLPALFASRPDSRPDARTASDGSKQTRE
ncbi:ATP synthase subunit I [Thiohalocapsa marina]|uniref:ATP synthase subunit I n=1 Tax=Thiohalocapsa marina TaxID=424902 RepID=UPI0036DDDC34